MFGLGIPTCDAVQKIPAMADFQAVVKSSIMAMAPAGKKLPFDPFLKYQSFWSMLHGLVSINMVAVDNMAGRKGGAEGVTEVWLEGVICRLFLGVQAAGDFVD